MNNFYLSQFSNIIENSWGSLTFGMPESFTGKCRTIKHTHTFTHARPARTQQIMKMTTKCSVATMYRETERMNNNTIECPALCNCRKPLVFCEVMQMNYFSLRIYLIVHNFWLAALQSSLDNFYYIPSLVLNISLAHMHRLMMIKCLICRMKHTLKLQ